MYHMYDVDDAERCFDKSGGGNEATVKLTRPRVRKAHEVLGDLVDGQ